MRAHSTGIGFPGSLDQSLEPRTLIQHPGRPVGRDVDLAGGPDEGVLHDLGRGRVAQASQRMPVGSAGISDRA